MTAIIMLIVAIGLAWFAYKMNQLRRQIDAETEKIKERTARLREWCERTEHENRRRCGLLGIDYDKLRQR